MNQFFFTEKYHRDAWREGYWVFGGIGRGIESGGSWWSVEQRDADTMLPLIEEWILPGTKIMSDGWPAYNNIDQIGRWNL